MPDLESGKTLNVLIAGVRWPPETFLERLIDGLLQAGLHVTVADSKRPQENWLNRSGFHWLRVPNWDKANYLHLVGQISRSILTKPDDLLVMKNVAKQTADPKQRLRLWLHWSSYAGKRWDVIYFPWNSGAIDHLALFDLGMPVVLSCRGSQIHTAPHNPLRSNFRDKLKLSLIKATFVHCVSENTRREAVELGLDMQKSIIIHPAVNSKFFVPLLEKEFSTKTFKIVSIGSLSWVKGYEYALEAISILKNAGVPLCYQIIGQGYEEQRIRYTINDLGLEQQVQLLGLQPPEVVRNYLQQADVYLLSSLSEGIANAALEAMACRIPVVTTECGGMLEAVTDGIEGLVTPLRQPEAMAQAMQFLWQRPALRQQMGARGRERVLSKFNLDQQISQFLDLFQEAHLAGGKQP